MEETSEGGRLSMSCSADHDDDDDDYYYYYYVIKNASFTYVILITVPNELPPICMHNSARLKRE
jgi:hypothetical protein